MVVFVSDMFAENYTGGAELTSEAIIIDSLIPVVKVHSRTLTTEIMENNKDKLKNGQTLKLLSDFVYLII